MKKSIVYFLLIIMSVSIIPSVAVGDLPQSDLLNVTFNASSYTDSAGKATITVSDNLEIAYDDTLKLNVAKFSGEGYKHADGSFMANDYIICHYGKDKLAGHTNAFTLETYFKVDSLPATGSVCPISGQQGGGLGFEVSSTGTLTFFCRSGSAYNKPKKDNVIEPGKYYHAIGVFNGSNVYLYLNGELVASETANGSTIAWPIGDEHNALVVGGDIGVEGKADHGITGSVALARAYSSAFTSEQAAAEYQEVVNMSKVEPPKTNPSTDETEPETNPSTSDSSILFITILVITISLSCILARRRIYS